MKLSIIVPVYNISTFIIPCLTSLVNVDLNPDEYEVIVVNDGSTDNSLEKIQDFASGYNHLKIISQKNQGLGVARNTGITHATGEYIWFVDGDDLVYSGKVSSALNQAINSGVDVLAFDFEPINENGIPEKWIDFKLNIKTESIQTGPEFYYLNFAKSYIWLYFFRRDVFILNGLTFENSIKMQDGEIMPRIMLYSSTVKCYDEKIICYRYRSNSAVHHKDESSRSHFYYSMVIVADKLRNLQHSLVNNEIMFDALNLKRDQLNQMLFTNLILSNYSKETNLYFIQLLKDYNLLPFKKITGFTYKMNLVYNLIRGIVNLNPFLGKRLYHKVFKRKR